MRKINAVLGPLMIILLLIHAISGSFQLYGIIPGGSLIRRILSILLVVCVAVHAVIGVILTVQTLRACRKTGKAYFKNNELFWISRISGFAMLFLIAGHILIFTAEGGDTFRLQEFGGFQLVLHILLLLALFMHLAVNIKPLCISLGIGNRKYVKDIMILLGIVMLVAASAFIVYFLRWQILWKYGH
jgi:succinate dehydrogenase/fumarate reductase cytochrome b subunit